MVREPIKALVSEILEGRCECPAGTDGMLAVIETAVELELVDLRILLARCLEIIDGTAAPAQIDAGLLDRIRDAIGHPLPTETAT